MFLNSDLPTKCSKIKMWQLKKAKLREKKGCFRLFQKRQIQKPVNKFVTKI